MAVHPPIATRRSPRAFDAVHTLSADQMRDLLEAARWAPSAMNRQPWHFIVGLRDDETHKAIFDTLNEGNQVWAWAASALAAVVVDNGPTAEAQTAHTDAGRAYEVGLAMGLLGVQAVAMGLATHQMGGFDRARLAEVFDLPGNARPLAVVAIGALGDPAELPEPLRAREAAPRQRRPLAEIAHAGVWGESWTGTVG